MNPPKDEFLEKRPNEQQTILGKIEENEDLGIPVEFTKDDVLDRPAGFADRPENFSRV